MKPVKFEKINPDFLDEHLLMLNAGMLGARYVGRLLSRGTTNVTSKGGLALPLELWDSILPMARGDAYVLVEAELVAETEGKKVLQCREVRLDRRAGHLFDSYEMDAYERVLNSRRKDDVFLMDEHENDDEDEDEGEYRESPKIVTKESTYRVIIEVGEKRPCIFEDIGASDVIARLEGGDCGLCSGDRFVCPMHNYEFKYFVGIIVQIGCRGDLACPLCLESVFYEHVDFLEGYEEEQPSREEERLMKWNIKMALKRLGYPPVLK